MPKLMRGDQAPHFRVIATDGRIVDLDELAGRKVWLIFYRYATCPLCCLHLSEVAPSFLQLRDHGVQIVTMFESKVPQYTSSVCGTEAAFFPMIPDPGREIYDLYGVERRLDAITRPSVFFEWLRARMKGFKQGRIDGDVRLVPAHFLILEDGTIHTAYYGRTIADHLPMEQVEKFARSGASEGNDPWVNSD